MANKIEKLGRLLCLLALGTACICPTNGHAQTADRTTATQQPGRQRTISGHVTDAEDEPLVGVPICIGESRVCTVTDSEGFYTFQIPEEQTVLKFSYVGMDSQYVAIAAGGTDVLRNIR